MPWWIWLLLVLFMLAMIAAGLVYAVRRALHALGVVSETGAAMGERLARMGESRGEDDAARAPSFTEPLRETAARYERAQTEIAERAQNKRSRHVGAWKRWKAAPLNQLPGSNEP